MGDSADRGRVADSTECQPVYSGRADACQKVVSKRRAGDSKTLAHRICIDPVGERSAGRFYSISLAGPPRQPFGRAADSTGGEGYRFYQHVSPYIQGGRTPKRRVKAATAWVKLRRERTYRLYEQLSAVGFYSTSWLGPRQYIWHGETITNAKSSATTLERRRHIRQRYCGVIGVSCLAFVASRLLIACASSPPPVQQQAQSNPQVSQVASNSDKVPAVTEPAQIATDEDANALESLWKTRTAATGGDPSSGFALGPGDVLQISLPQIDHTKDRTVRVSEENTIALPLLGVISVSNMTEEDLRNDLTRRMSKFFYHPQVALFLRHTEGRQVAVSGAVKAPGRYMLASRSDTIMMMISRAGGVTPEAAPRIILIPAAGTASPRATLPAAATQAQDPSSGDLPDAASAGEPSDSGVARVSQAQPAEADTSGAARVSIPRVVISLSRPSDQRYLNLPAKAGDVILVPAAGQVTVQGWVDKPGSFPITNGMTALGAIAAAGGALFTPSATLLREQENGTKTSIPLNISRIKGGQEPDPEVHGGDVVIVERSAAGALPYSLYTIVSKMGIGIPIPIP